MFGRDSTNRTFPESGLNGPWHGTSHHNDNPVNVKNYAIMNRYHVRLLSDFAKQLRDTPDGDGNLLDHSLTYMGSNMGNSHRHKHENVPVILVGGLQDGLKPAATCSTRWARREPPTCS